MSNTNTKTTTKKIFSMRGLIRNDWMGYKKILKQIKISIKRKRKTIMKTQRKITMLGI